MATAPFCVRLCTGKRALQGTVGRSRAYWRDSEGAVDQRFALVMNDLRGSRLEHFKTGAFVHSAIPPLAYSH